MGRKKVSLLEDHYVTPTPKRQYNQNVDYTFFEAMDVRIEEGKDPWVFFVTHDDLRGRFVWYPTTGTLVFEPPRQQAYTIATTTDSEDVYKYIMEIINKDI